MKQAFHTEGHRGTRRGTKSPRGLTDCLEELGGVDHTLLASPKGSPRCVPDRLGVRTVCMLGRKATTWGALGPAGPWLLCSVLQWDSPGHSPGVPGECVRVCLKHVGPRRSGAPCHAAGFGRKGSVDGAECQRVLPAARRCPPAPRADAAVLGRVSPLPREMSSSRGSCGIGALRTEAERWSLSTSPLNRSWKPSALSLSRRRLVLQASASHLRGQPPPRFPQAFRSSRVYTSQPRGPPV